MNWLTLFSLVSIVFSFFLLGIAVYRNVKNWRTHDDHDTPPVGLEVRTSLLLVVYSVTGVYGYVNKLAFENPMYWRGLTALIVVQPFSLLPSVSAQCCILFWLIVVCLVLRLFRVDSFVPPSGSTLSYCELENQML